LAPAARNVAAGEHRREREDHHRDDGAGARGVRHERGPATPAPDREPGVERYGRRRNEDHAPLRHGLHDSEPPSPGGSPPELGTHQEMLRSSVVAIGRDFPDDAGDLRFGPSSERPEFFLEKHTPFAIST